MPRPRTFSIGQQVNNFLIRAFSHTKQHKDKKTTSFYEVECVNCHAVFLKQAGNIRMQKGHCRSCEGMLRGEAGLNRLLYYYKRNSQKVHRPFDLTMSEFRQLTSSSCFYCSAEPLLVMTCNRYHPSKKSTWGNYLYNGIDRIDGERGYVRGNCIPCCHFCNRARNSYTFEEFTAYWIELYRRCGSSAALLAFSSRLKRIMRSSPKSPAAKTE